MLSFKSSVHWSSSHNGRFLRWMSACLAWPLLLRPQLPIGPSGLTKGPQLAACRAGTSSRMLRRIDKFKPARFRANQSRPKRKLLVVVVEWMKAQSGFDFLQRNADPLMAAGFPRPVRSSRSDFCMAPTRVEIYRTATDWNLHWEIGGACNQWIPPLCFIQLFLEEQLWWVAFCKEK